MPLFPLPARPYAVALLIFVAAQAAAQAPQLPAPSRPAGAAGWRVTSLVSTETEFNDNVFLLEASKRDDLGTPSSDALASGRYAGMEHASDFVTTVRAAMTAQRRGIGGRRLEVTPQLGYELYAMNADRRNATLSLEVEQTMRRDGRARFQAQFTPSYFGRNYLAEAVDANADGSIAPAERVYAAGRYQEMELGLDYRFRLNKASKKSPFGAMLQLEGGYHHRAYEAPFAGRDIGGPIGGATLLLDLTPRVSLDASFELAMMHASPRPEVVLRDEPDFGRDFNGNGTVDDLEARAVEMVDRSRNERTVGLDARIEMTPELALQIGVRHRTRSYTSREEFDIANNGRTSQRNEVEASLRRELTDRVRLVAGVAVASQTQNRENDLGAAGDEADYRSVRMRLGLALRY